jgi:phosphinothricin acetyltransferase
VTDAVSIRPGEPADAGAIAAIYNEGIADRVATFETRPRGPEEVLGWTGNGAAPLLVAEADGQVLGWARAGDYSDRCVYEGVREYAVYVARDARGRGVGRVLLDALIAVSEQRGSYKLISRIFPENTASLNLARACGFREVGVHLRHGKLDGVWKDTVVVERLLGEAAEGVRDGDSVYLDG